MVRLLLRALGFSLLAAAFAALVVDGSRSIAGDGLLFYTLGDAVAGLGGAHVAPAGWPESARWAVAGLLAAPASPAVGLCGLLMLFAGRPAAPDAGFSDRGS